jgi:hypothetical protein
MIWINFIKILCSQQTSIFIIQKLWIKSLKQLIRTYGWDKKSLKNLDKNQVNNHEIIKQFNVVILMTLMLINIEFYL